MAEALDSTLLDRLREILGGEPATEAELRSVLERADAWARTVDAQIQASERRLGELADDAGAPLSEIAAELRRIERLRPELNELRSRLDELGTRARELRTAWLLGRQDRIGPAS